MMSTTTLVTNGQVQRLVCLHWKIFPPAGAVSENIQGDRISGVISPTEYQRLQVWQRICGLLKMDVNKCQTCPHARILETSQQGSPPMFVTLDGSSRTPALDIPTMSLRPEHREHLGMLNRPAGKQGSNQTAAWLEKAQEKEKTGG